MIMSWGTISDLSEWVSGLAGAVSQWLNWVANLQFFGIHVYTIFIVGVIASVVALILYGGDSD